MCIRDRSTTWCAGCVANWPGRCPRGGRHTGFVIRTPQPCCCPGPGARGESPTGPQRRADDVERVRPRDRGRRDADRRAVEGVHVRVAGRDTRGDPGRVVLMSGARSDVWPDRGPGAAGDRQAILQRLWQAVPAGMRLTYFDVDTVPQEYRGGMGQRPGRAAGVDLSMLPTPIRQELAWCVFRIIEQGGNCLLY